MFSQSKNENMNCISQPPFYQHTVGQCSRTLWEECAYGGGTRTPRRPISHLHRHTTRASTGRMPQRETSPSRSMEGAKCHPYMGVHMHTHCVLQSCNSPSKLKYEKIIYHLNSFGNSKLSTIFMRIASCYLHYANTFSRLKVILAIEMCQCFGQQQGMLHGTARV